MCKWFWPLGSNQLFIIMPMAIEEIYPVKKRILIVEDEAVIAKEMKASLEGLGYEVPLYVQSGEEAIEEAENRIFDLVLMDIVIKGDIDGIKTAKVIRDRFGIPVVYTTANANEATIRRAKVTGPYGYLVKPFSKNELHSIVEVALYKHGSDERHLKAMESMIDALTMTIEGRIPHITGHHSRVARLATAISEEMGLPQNDTKGIRLAAKVHDIGKIKIPSKVLEKTEALTQAELKLIKNHPGAGYEMLKEIDTPWPIAEMVLHHHERLDGSGYPLGLTENDIRPGAKIIAVADVVEAMTSSQQYRPAIDIKSIFGGILENRDILYDGRVVDACVKLFMNKGFRW